MVDGDMIEMVERKLCDYMAENPEPTHVFLGREEAEELRKVCGGSVCYRKDRTDGDYRMLWRGLVVVVVILRNFVGFGKEVGSHGN